MKTSKRVAAIGSTVAVLATLGLGGAVAAQASDPQPAAPAVQAETESPSDGPDQGPDANPNQPGHQDTNQGPDANPSESGHQDADETGETE